MSQGRKFRKSSTPPDPQLRAFWVPTGPMRGAWAGRTGTRPLCQGYGIRTLVADPVPSHQGSNLQGHDAAPPRVAERRSLALPNRGPVTETGKTGGISWGSL